MKKIGIKIRELRKRKKWTLEDLSSRCGLSVSFLSQVERGNSSLSLVSVHNLCQALNIPISEMFTESEDDLQKEEKEAFIPVTREDDQLIVQIGYSPISYRYLSRVKLPGRTLEALITEFPPNFEHPLQTHEGEEFGYVLEGNIELTLDGNTYYLKPGDSFHFHGSTPHSYKAANMKARVISTTTADILPELSKRLMDKND